MIGGRKEGKGGKSTVMKIEKYKQRKKYSDRRKRRRQGRKKIQ